MRASLALLKFVAKAALNAVGFGMAGDFATEVVPHLWASWGKGRSEQERKADVQALVQAPESEVRQQAREVVREIAADRSPEEQFKLETYLNEIPSVARQSLRRPEDPHGRTVPAHVRMVKAEDLLPILPQRLPRFKPGDRPLGNMVPWELVKRLGVGGFGEVWRARNPDVPSLQAALKFCLDSKAQQLLKHEASVIASVMSQEGHPGIVRLKQAYLSADPPCLEYEFIEGSDLASAIHAHLAAKGPLTPDMATKIILHLARAVGHAHNRSIVHRDLKPANVLVRWSGGKTEFLITDFGIGGVAANQALEQVRQGTTSTPMLTSLQGAHTPLYASPEQKRGELPDPRDDVHALGVIWYQLLLGDFSVGAPTGGAWRKALTQRGLSDPLLRLLESCFDAAEHRPRNAAVVAQQIDAIREPQSLATTIIVTVSRNPSVYGEEVTFSARVKGVASAATMPSGDVTFLDGSNDLGTIRLEGGAATLKTTALGAGSHAITARYSGDNGFLASESASLNQIVNRAPLTVAANQASRFQGQANPAFGVTYRGFVNGENETSLDGMLTISTLAAQFSQAGPYRLTPGGLNSSNYTITFLDGTLTVTPWCEQDIKDALEEWRTKGSTRAYFERQGPARIRDWQMAAQQAGDPAAMWLLARCLQEGAGVDKNPQAAVAWLQRAAESGLALAQNELGDCYYAGEGVEEDSAEAFRLYMKAAAQGFPEAQRNLGVCYYGGEGVEENLGEAVTWFRKAAEQGWAEAQSELGGCYYEGSGVPQDYTEAVRCYRKAAELGNASGQEGLGYCYLNGYGIEEDYPQAITWFRRAAEQGQADAQADLGDCYYNGKGVKKDRAEAVKWYRKGAEQGHAGCQYCLGYCYEYGHGVEQDLAEAKRWHGKAADQGHRKAKNALKRLKPAEGGSKQEEESQPLSGPDQEQLTFNTLLHEAEFSPSDVRLVRHADQRATKGRTPYDLWHHDRPQFECYQSTQSIGNRAKLTAPYWAVFLGTPDGKTMFVGVYEVKYRGLLEQDTPMPHREGLDKAGSCDVYDLTLKPELGEWIGKLFIDWGPGALAWVQYADRQDKPITEMGNEPAIEAQPKQTEELSREERLLAIDPQMMAAKPLRKAQLACLAVLAKANEPMTGTELAEKAGVDKSVIGGNCGYRDPEINKRACHAGNLLNRGFVEIEKRQDANGRMRFYYLITEAGRKALAVTALEADWGEDIPSGSFRGPEEAGTDPKREGSKQ